MVFLVSKSGMSIRKEEKQFTTLQRNTASSTSFEFHLDHQHICHPPVIYSLFLPEEYEEGKKKISALVKMGNRCSNNDWRQLMFLGRSNGLDLCSASDFYSKQTQGKCKCEIKVLFSRQRKTVSSDCIVVHFCYDLTV